MEGKLIEIEQFQTWVCIKCGTVVVSTGRPSMRWDDGHDCVFVLKELDEQEEGPPTHAYPIGTPLRCNQCQAKFMVEIPLVADRINLVFTSAYRLRERMACPECGEADLHWIHTCNTSQTKGR